MKSVVSMIALFASVFFSHSLLADAGKCPDFSGTYEGVGIDKVSYTMTLKQTECEALEIVDSRYAKPIIFFINGTSEQSTQGGPLVKFSRATWVGQQLFIEDFGANKNRILTIVMTMDSDKNLVTSALLDSGFDAVATGTSTTSKRK
jgi:hypothetical protein